MKWTILHDMPAIVYSDADLAQAAPLFQKASELWEMGATRGDKYRGSAVIGAGVGVLYLPYRCRNPRGKIVIGSPFQSDGGGSVGIALNYLARHGIAAFHVYGRMD